MSFPIGPTNNQTAVVNGITYVYSSANNAWTRVTANNITVTGNITAGNLTTSGTSGNISGVNYIFAGNYAYANGVSILTGIGGTYSNTNVAAYLTLGATIGSGSTTSNLVAAATTTSTSTTTGALVVKGGAGIAGVVNIGTSLTVDGGAYGNVATTQFASVYGQAYGSNPYSIMQVRSNDFASGMGIQTYAGLNGLLYSNTGIQFQTSATVRDKDFPTGGTIAGQFAANGAFIAQTGIASTSTGTGAVIVKGGMGVAGNIYSGANVVITNGIFWAANGSSYSSASSNNPFTEDSDLGRITDSVSSSYDLGLTTDLTISDSYDLGSLITNLVVYGTSIIANTVPGDKLITGTNIAAGILTASNVTSTILVSTDTANIAGNLTSGNLLPQSNVTYNLGSPSLKWKDLYLSGSSIYLDDIVITAGIGTAQINGMDIATVDNHDLDDVSGYTDGVRQIFPLTYNLSNVSLSSPWQLTVAVNGIPLPAFNNSPNAYIVWQSLVFPANKGYTLESNSGIKFAEAPGARSDVYIRKQPGTTPSVIKVYPFKPIDIMIGY